MFAIALIFLIAFPHLLLGLLVAAIALPFNSPESFWLWLVATGAIAAIVVIVFSAITKGGYDKAAGKLVAGDVLRFGHTLAPAALWPLVQSELVTLAQDPRFSDASVNDVAIHILTKYAGGVLQGVALEDVVRAVGNFVSAFRSELIAELAPPDPTKAVPPLAAK